MPPVRPTPSPFIDVWKDVTLEVYLETPNVQTGRLEPATGLANLTLGLAATEQGPIIGALSGTATERSANPGNYWVTLDLATVTADLPDGATYPHGADIFLQVRQPGDIEPEGFRKKIRRRKY